jgi:hypothetical protein
MKRCRACHIPLEGRWARILKKVLRLEQSAKDPGLCNKCAAKGANAAPLSDYVCPICNRQVDEKTALTHIKAEEYLLELIRKDHPEWKEGQGACPKCMDYYRQLIKQAKI